MTFHVFYKDNQSEANVIAEFSPGKKQSFKIQRNVDEKGILCGLTSENVGTL